MCGIAGLFDPRHGLTTESLTAVATAMTDALVHRGDRLGDGVHGLPVQRRVALADERIGRPSRFDVRRMARGSKVADSSSTEVVAPDTSLSAPPITPPIPITCLSVAIMMASSLGSITLPSSNLSFSPFLGWRITSAALPELRAFTLS